MDHANTTQEGAQGHTDVQQRVDEVQPAASSAQRKEVQNERPVPDQHSFLPRRSPRKPKPIDLTASDLYHGSATECDADGAASQAQGSIRSKTISDTIPSNGDVVSAANDTNSRLYTYLLSKTLMELRPISKKVNVQYTGKSKGALIVSIISSLVLTYDTEDEIFDGLTSVYDSKEIDKFIEDISNGTQEVIPFNKEKAMQPERPGRKRKSRDEDNHSKPARKKKGNSTQCSRPTSNSNHSNGSRKVGKNSNVTASIPQAPKKLDLNEFARLILILRDDEETNEAWKNSMKSKNRVEVDNKEKLNAFWERDVALLFNSDLELKHDFPECVGEIQLGKPIWKRTGAQLQAEIVEFKKGFNGLHDKYIHKTGQRSDDFIEFMREEGKDFDSLIVKKEVVAATLYISY